MLQAKGVLHETLLLRPSAQARRADAKGSTNRRAEHRARGGARPRTATYVGAVILAKQRFLGTDRVAAVVAFDVLSFSGLALVLGAKHAFDVDHIVAVSNILSRQTRWERTVALSASWAAGHMVTAGLVSAGVYFFADTFLPTLTGHMEKLVPFMLILIGALGLFAMFRKFHYHRHQHEPQGRSHGHFHLHLKPHHQHGAMVGIGVVHGLASNDELLLVLLVGLGADAWWQVGLGVALFSAGVLVAMAIYATIVHGASQRWQAGWVPDAATGLFSLASIAYAVYLLAGGEGLTLLERFRQ